MDRLQFILGSLQSPTAAGSEGMMDEMLAIAIRSEIESIMHGSTAAFSSIVPYMIQIRPTAA